MKLPPVERNDRFTFRGRILGETQGGAFLITDGTSKRPVPKSWVIVEPVGAPFNTFVDITMLRSVAREKGFLRESGPGQGRLAL